jgi:type II secretory pathway component PulF
MFKYHFYSREKNALIKTIITISRMIKTYTMVYHFGFRVLNYIININEKSLGGRKHTNLTLLFIPLLYKLLYIIKKSEEK